MNHYLRCFLATEGIFSVVGDLLSLVNEVGLRDSWIQLCLVVIHLIRTDSMILNYGGVSSLQRR